MNNEIAAINDDDVAAVAKLNEAYRVIRSELSKVIVGQAQVLEELLIALFARGHCLLVGVPGLAKTLMIRSLADAVSLRFSRIQFTPDLMPSDITGTDVIEEDVSTGQRHLKFIQGPIFSNMVLADEINRTPPKTQAALLQAMQEKEVTVGNKTYKLEEPFLVLATQNPIEQEGTYPLPEAQLDRFLMQIDVEYPDRAAERRIVFETTGVKESKAKQAMTAEELMAAQRLVRRLPVGESVVDAILTLVRSARPGTDAGEFGKLIAWGPSPRASQSLMLVARAKALLDGRLAPSIDDVIAMAEPVLKHRMALTFAARADGETITGVIGKLTSRIG